MEIAFKPTTHGRAILSACMSHTLPLQLTRVAFGSGRVSENRNLADMHELIQYVADGTIGDRRHEDDRLYLTVQYANDAAHASVSTFMLSEFIIYARNPETGEDQDFIYATLGDYSQSIPAYRAGFPPGTWSLPLVIIVSDDIQVSISAPAGLVTHDELLRLLDRLAAGAAMKQFSIPAAGWMENTEPDHPYPLCLDIPNADIAGSMVSMLAVLPWSATAAARCGLCPVSRTLDGVLRVYAWSIPTDSIHVSLTLLETVRDAHTGLAGSAAVGRADITIPASGWTPDTDTNGAFPLHLDIPRDTILEAHVPALTILPGSLETAEACGISTCARTLPGTLRVYAKTVPADEIHTSLALLSIAAGINVDTVPSVPGGVLPVAGSTTLGGVKVGPGSGLTVDGSGNLKLDAAPKETVVNLFKGSNG